MASMPRCGDGEVEGLAGLIEDMCLTYIDFVQDDVEDIYIYILYAFHNMYTYIYNMINIYIHIFICMCMCLKLCKSEVACL